MPLILEQLPPATITPTHQNVVKYYVSELNKVTHKPVILPMVLQIRETMVLQGVELEGKGSPPHF